MKFDLDKFNKPLEMVVPVVDSHFQFKRKKYNLDCDNGWYRVKAVGNNAEIIEKIYMLEGLFDNLKPVLGYVYGDNIIFQNFDSAKRKFGLHIQAPLLLNNAIETFSPVEALYWEDKKFYFYRVNYKDIKIFNIKQAYSNETSLDLIKGLTQELRTLYLFHDIQRQQRKAEFEEIKKAREKEEYLKSIPGKLEIIFQRAGAKILNFSIIKDKAEVDWRLLSYNKDFNSVINLKTWMIEECGFCMSGQDKLHNITSMVKTVERFEDNEEYYEILRHRK